MFFLAALFFFPALLAQKRPEQTVSHSRTRFALTGHVVTADGRLVANAIVSIGNVKLRTNEMGGFVATMSRGHYEMRVETSDNIYKSLPITVDQDRDIEIEMPMRSSVLVRGGAAADILDPDPSLEAYDRSDLIAANAGQTLETFAMPGERVPFQRIVGCPGGRMATVRLFTDFDPRQLFVTGPHAKNFDYVLLHQHLRTSRC